MLYTLQAIDAMIRGPAGETSPATKRRADWAKSFALLGGPMHLIRTLTEVCQRSKAGPVRKTRECTTVTEWAFDAMFGLAWDVFVVVQNAFLGLFTTHVMTNQGLL